MLSCISGSGVFRFRHNSRVTLSNLSARSPRYQIRSFVVRASVGRMSDEHKLLSLTQKLLDSIVSSDYHTYSLLCAEDLTCFEPEAKGTLMEGKDFHKWYFDQYRNLSENPSTRSNVCHGKVRMLGKEAAVVTYIRVDQMKHEGIPKTKKYEETRVWQIINGAWTNVHFHRSALDR